jgi:hypothetical protein
MLETIREFAVEQLEASGTADDYRAGHQAHYLELAERGGAALGTAGQVKWLGRLSRENDNFRAVLRRALRREDAVGALRMGQALASFWYISGSYAEGRGWMEQVAGLTAAQPYERAVARTIAAIEAFIQGDFEPIETGLGDALRVAAEGGDRRTVAFAQLLQAVARGSRSDDEQWQDAVTAASRRLEAEGDQLAVGFGLVAAAVLARVHGRMEEAQRLAQQAHDLSVQIGESYMRGYASTQLARACLGLGDVMAARNSAIEALLVARRLPNVVAMSYALELWATGTSTSSRRRAPSTWIGLLASSSSPIRWPSGCPTAVMDHLQPYNRICAPIAGHRGNARRRGLPLVPAGGPSYGGCPARWPSLARPLTT